MSGRERSQQLAIIQSSRIKRNQPKLKLPVKRNKNTKKDN